MPQFESLWAGGPMFAQAEHFRMGTDSILLAHFASPRGRNAINLGCASGIIGVLMLANAPKLHVTGLEIVPEAAELARENMRVNGFAERSRVVCGDIREHRQLFTARRAASTRLWRIRRIFRRAAGKPRRTRAEPRRAGS